MIKSKSQYQHAVNESTRAHSAHLSITFFFLENDQKTSKYHGHMVSKRANFCSRLDCRCTGTSLRWEKTWKMRRWPWVKMVSISISGSFANLVIPTAKMIVNSAVHISIVWCSGILLLISYASISTCQIKATELFHWKNKAWEQLSLVYRRMNKCELQLSLCTL